VAAYDFSAPFAAARILDVDGNAWPLWVNVGGAESGRPSMPGGEDLKALAWVDQIEVKLDLSGIPVITVQLAPPFEEGMKFLDSSLIDSAGQNMIEVQLGYASGTSDGQATLSPPFSGLIFNPQVAIDTQIQITLTGQGVASFSEIRQPGRTVSVGNLTRREIIRRLARGAGRSTQVNFDSADLDDQCRALLDASPSQGFVQGNRTDWVALWQLARQTRCWMNIQGDTLYWLSYSERFATTPTRIYRMYHYPGGRVQGMTDQGQGSSGGELPILSFSCDTDAVWLPASQHGILTTDVSDRDRQPVERFASPQSEAPAALGNGSMNVRGSDNLPLDDQTHAGAEVRPVDPEDEDGQVQVSSEIQQGANIGVSLQVEVPGDPSVLPGHTVRLAGLGRRFDGPIYAVHTVTHSIGTGGFTTNLMLITNSPAAETAVRGGIEPTGGVNTQRAHVLGFAVGVPAATEQGDR
jgi:hypothetical protein